VTTRPNAYLVDIDGTVADVQHRLHLLPDWAAFFGAMEQDPPIQPVIDIVNRLSVTDRIVFVSGRPEEYRTVTLDWLRRQHVMFDALFMRPSGDYRPDHVVKAELLAQIRERFDVQAVIDDRPSVVEMWRREGLVCLQNAPVETGRWDEQPLGALTLLVGASGAGKSTWASRQRDALVLSSDAFRGFLLGDPGDQTQNGRVFAALHATARAALKAQVPVILDATHLAKRDRRTALALVPEGTAVTYRVFERPLAELLETRGHRDPAVVERLYGRWLSVRDAVLAGDCMPNVTVVRQP
jgi:predicted kinase